MSNKLVLGTVQFGCQYGINSVGRPDEKIILEILDLASRSGITTLDTSSAYGNAESILGNVLPMIDHSFQIISKYPQSEETVGIVLDRTLYAFGVSHIYGYLLHHFEVYRENPAIWKEFEFLKTMGKVSKIGFSLYSTAELDLLFERNVSFDLLQIPYNLFDRQFESYLPLLKEQGVEVHVRSTFLQGLFFKDRGFLPEKLKPLKKCLKQLDDYVEKSGKTLAEIALNFNLQNPLIDGVLIGVDTVGQLQDNIRSVSDKKIELSIEVSEKELLNPTNWK